MPSKMSLRAGRHHDSPEAHGIGFRSGRSSSPPATPPDPFAHHGRGLFLIGALMDDVRIVQGRGVAVHMSRSLTR